MDVNFLVPILLNNFHGFFNVSNTTLTKNVQFFKAQVFGHIHVPLRSRKAFGRQIERGVVGEGFFRNQDSACMDTP